MKILLTIWFIATECFAYIIIFVDYYLRYKYYLHLDRKKSQRINTDIMFTSKFKNNELSPKKQINSIYAGYKRASASIKLYDQWTGATCRQHGELCSYNYTQTLKRATEK